MENKLKGQIENWLAKYRRVRGKLQEALQGQTLYYKSARMKQSAGVKVEAVDFVDGEIVLKVKHGRLSRKVKFADIIL